MKKYDLVIIGFGKAGKTLAKFAADNGKKVALIEESKDMYGGTCINIGCIPSKVLANDSLIKVQVEEELKQNIKWEEAVLRKKEVVDVLNEKNYQMISSSGVDIYDSRAYFRNNSEISLIDSRGNIRDTLSADIFVINTGATHIVPDIKGAALSKRVYNATEIMDYPKQIKKLVIIGGGYIALEFASTFANFGSSVTVLEKQSTILGSEDEEIREEILKDFAKKDVNFVFDTDVFEIEDFEKYSKVKTSKGDFEADVILIAVGRKPNTEKLGLENTDVKVASSGEILVNEFLETDAKNIFAVGDVKGGLQFTYISLDDFRIVKDKIFGEGKRTTQNRGTVPYTMFIDPPFSRVGMTLKQAQQKNIDAIESKLLVMQIPRHKINNDARGIFKVVIDKKERTILGASLYGKQSEELINIIRLAIEQNIKIDVLRDGIYTHPTMAECFNDLFNVKL